MPDDVKLNNCIQCDSPAVLQIREKMGRGDYKEQQKVNRKGRYVADPDYYLDVHLDESNRNDCRVSCSECDNATPWNKRDVPNMPGVGLRFTQDLWNRLNPPQKT